LAPLFLFSTACRSSAGISDFIDNFSLTAAKFR
jgi:hypothetical protein